MAITLAIYDGTTTINLSGGTGTINGCEYVPTPVPVSEAMAGGVIEDRIDLDLQGTAANMIADIDSLEDMFARARRRQTEQTGARIYLQYTVAAGEDTHRSEIVDGSVELSSDAGRRSFAGGWLTVPLSVQRRPYWEGPEATLVNGTSIANGETGNYVDISAGSIEGTIPAPMRIQVQNTSGAAQAVRRIYIAANAFNDPANYTGFLLGDTLSWTGASDHTTPRKTWSLTDAMLADQAGDRFHVLAAFTSLTTGAYFRAESQFFVTTDEVTNEVAGTNSAYELLDLGTLRLPPGGANSVGNSIDVAMTARHTATGSGVLDFVQLLPAAEFRHIKQRDYQVNHLAYIVDDGIEDLLYILNGSDRWPRLVGYGKPPRLWPGRANRVYVLWDGDTGFDATKTANVYIYYRPRRAVL